MDGKKRIARLRNAMWKKDKVPIVNGKIEFKAVGLNALECKPNDLWMLDVVKQMVPVHREPENPHPLKNPRLFIQRLQKRGFEVLGTGCYSTVLAKPGSERVIKVNRNTDNWIDYVQWAAKAGYAGGLAPKVYSWKRHDDWAVAVVERMEKTTYHTDYKKDDQSLIMTLLYPAKAGSVMAKLYMEDLVPGSVEFFANLRKEGFDGDISSGNVMLRKDGSICVTDPCAGHIRTTEKRFRTGANAPVHLEVFIARSHRYRSEWAA